MDIAAGVALIHDVLMTIGMIALSYYVVEAVPALATLLKIESFQINLTIVAALLTIIGYSVNDTIVTFDRLREIKGKTPSIDGQDGERQHQPNTKPHDFDGVHRVHRGGDPVFLRRRGPAQLRIRVLGRHRGRNLQFGLRRFARLIVAERRECCGGSRNAGRNNPRDAAGTVVGLAEG